MFRSRWLHKLQTAQRTRGARLMLETLEDRITPSTIMENAPDAATLQADLSIATPANALSNTVATNTRYVINLTGTSADYRLAAGSELTIPALGAGGGVTIAGHGQSITGNGNHVVFIGGGASVTIQDVTIAGGSATGSNAQGGGVYISGSCTVQIIDSTISGNSVRGANGTAAGQSGGNAQGGGIYVTGSGWNVTLRGDTFSGNTAISGNGNGAPGGLAAGGAACFLGGGSGASLTILNDPNSPSLMVGNSATAGSGGDNSAEGGAVFLSAPGATIHIGNTTFYGNHAAGDSGSAVGGAMDFRRGNFIMVNSTVANNSATLATKGGTTYGGGIADNDPQSVVFDNNTFTRNTIAGGTNYGAGLSLDPVASNPTLFNNLILGNNGIGSPFADLEITGGQTPIRSDNLIGSIGILSSKGNSITNNNIPAQLGGVVGVTANGAASGGPIYYPLLPNAAASIGTGNTSALNTIATVEGTTTANATDEIGNPRSSNGTIDIGAVQHTDPAPAAVHIAIGRLQPVEVSSRNQRVKISVNITSPNAEVDTGAVTFALYNSNNVQVGKAVQVNVSHGKAQTFLIVPGGTAAGSYTLTANYTNPIGEFADDTATATLTIRRHGPRGHGNPPPHNPSPGHGNDPPAAGSQGADDLGTVILKWIASLEQIILSNWDNAEKMSLSAMQGKQQQVTSLFGERGADAQPF